MHALGTGRQLGSCGGALGSQQADRSVGCRSYPATCLVLLLQASIAARKPDFDAYIDPQKKKADMIIQVRRGAADLAGRGFEVSTLLLGGSATRGGKPWLAPRSYEAASIHVWGSAGPGDSASLGVLLVLPACSA